MGTYGFPDIVGFYDMLYGTAGVDWQTLTLYQFSQAAGRVWNNNPPYTLTQFLAIYPKFFGPPTNITGVVITQGSPIITGIPSSAFPSAETVVIPCGCGPSGPQGLAIGELVVSSLFAPDALIIATDPTAGTITMNSDALANGTSFTVYESPFVPIVVLLSYTTLAHYCVMITRYFATWPFMMALFVAHYATLYMRSESGPNATASEVAASGLAKGITISRHAGDVGATQQLLGSYEQWGAWTETQYGEQFITIARATNCGPIWVG